MLPTLIDSLFINAKQRLTNGLPAPELHARLSTLAMEVVAPATMVHNLTGDNYRNYTRIPAYYDPNTHTIFINRAIVPDVNEKTLYTICYHELVHGASYHSTYTEGDAQVFQSGIKTERYGDGWYTCAHRLLNEGIVQYFTVKHTNQNHENLAYKHEVAIVKQLIEKLGEPVISRALYYGTVTELEDVFNRNFGAGTFFTFSRHIDKRRYSEAEAMVTVTAPLTLQKQSPSYVS